jgi:hypothetical protein
MELLIYNYDKNYLGYENLNKKRLKLERLSYECLYEFFNDTQLNTHNEYEYFLTSYKKKENYGLRVKFYLRRKKKTITIDDTHTIETLKGFYCLDGEEHTYLKKYPKNKVIGIKRTEDVNLVHFYVVVEDQRIKPDIINLINKCNICYETNKDTYQNGFFKCSHKEICLECYNKLAVKRCPICRNNLLNLI